MPPPPSAAAFVAGHGGLLQRPRRRSAPVPRNVLAPAITMRSRRNPRGQRGRDFNAPPPDAAPPERPPLPPGPPPVVRSGHVGWREPGSPGRAEDDAFWRAIREAEKAYRGPHVAELDPSIEPEIPLGRDGKPIRYPAAVIFDGVNGWRPTTEEEEAKLRGNGEYDPFRVEARPFKNDQKTGTAAVAEEVQRGDEGVEPGGEMEEVTDDVEGEETTEEDKQCGNDAKDEDDVLVRVPEAQTLKPPFSTLSVRILSGGAGSVSTSSGTPKAIGTDANRGHQSAKAVPVRRPLDLPAGAWRVVNLGTSSAVPTRKRNVSCTAFIAARPPGRQRDPATITPEEAPDDPTMFLVDAGENASKRLSAAFWCKTHGFRWVRAIFITHLHGDHIYGLPSLLQNIGSCAQFRRRRALERGDDGTDPVIRIYGPYGTRGFLRTSLYWTKPLGVRFSVAELVPRDCDFKHLRAGGGFFIGSKDVVHGVPEEERVNLSRDTPPPHPEEVRVEDVWASEDGLWHVWNDDDGSGVNVCAAPLKHRVPCFGYVFSEAGESAGPPRHTSVVAKETPSSDGDSAAVAAYSGSKTEIVVDMGKAKALGVIGRQYNVLRSGRSVTVKKTNTIVSPADVALVSGHNADDKATQSDAALSVHVPVGGRDDVEQEYDAEALRPRKVVLLGDTCDSSAISAAAMGADLLVHEATFADALRDKAKIAMHSTARMAGAFAREIEARRLVLSHFSSRYEATQLAALLSEYDQTDSSGDPGRAKISGAALARDFEEVDDDEGLDEDLVSPNLLVREAAESYGSQERIVAATDFMEHTVFRPWHGNEEWRARTTARESSR